MNHYLSHLLRSSLVIVLLYTISTSALIAQKIKLVKDIRTVENPEFGSYPASFIKADDRFFFTAYTDETGRELWVSDGTDAGTRMVKDIMPGNSSSVPIVQLALNGFLYFLADDGIHGHELWKSDGTSAGTTLIKDLFPGFTSSNPDDFTVIGNTIYFTANDDFDQRHLWFTDGTANGTFKISLLPFFRSIGPQNLFANDETLYFRAYHIEFRTWVLYELKSKTGDLKLIDLPLSETNEHSGAGNFSVVGDNLYTTTRTRPNGPLTFWKVNLKTYDVVPISLPTNKEELMENIQSNSLTNLDSGIIFISYNKRNGSQLWNMSGDTSKLKLLASFPFQSNFINPTSFTVHQNKLYFINNDRSLWTTDGTSAGTQEVKPIGQSSGHRLAISTFRLLHNKLVYFAQDSTNQYALWTLDSSGNVAIKLNDASTMIYGIQETDFVSFDSVVFYSGIDSIHGRELWRSDGKTNGTHLFKNIVNKPGSSYPSNLTFRQNKLFFTANDGMNGKEMWHSIGDSNSTKIVYDFTPKDFESTDPHYLKSIDDKLLFVSTYHPYMAHLYALPINHTEPKIIHEIGLPYNHFLRVEQTDKHIFYVHKKTPIQNELWRTDGTPNSLQKLISSGGSFEEFRVSETQNASIFIFGGDLWLAKYGSGGAETLNLRNKKCNVWSQSELVTSNNITYFSAWDVTQKTGGELWCRDGITGEVRLVKDINPGKASSNVSNFFAYKSRMFFQVDRNNETELWITNGTEKGTYKVKTLLQSPRLDYELVGDRLFIKTRNHFDIDNLWITDGTESGTMLVTEYFWLTGASNITSMVAANDLLYFTLANVDYGEELWQSDGTKEGTMLVEDLMPGSKSSSPKELTVGNNKLYFSAEHPTYGRELFYIDVPASIKSDVVNIEPYTLFPNPAIDEITIEYEQHDPGQKHTVEIRNMLGQQIQVYQSSLNPFTIDITGLRSGTYFFQIDDYSVKKVVVY